MTDSSNFSQTWVERLKLHFQFPCVFSSNWVTFLWPFVVLSQTEHSNFIKFHHFLGLFPTVATYFVLSTLPLSRLVSCEMRAAIATLQYQYAAAVASVGHSNYFKRQPRTFQRPCRALAVLSVCRPSKKCLKILVRPSQERPIDLHIWLHRRSLSSTYQIGQRIGVHPTPAVLRHPDLPNFYQIWLSCLLRASFNRPFHVRAENHFCSSADSSSNYLVFLPRKVDYCGVEAFRLRENSLDLSELVTTFPKC